jgi:hypothetical protein
MKRFLEQHALNYEFEEIDHIVSIELSTYIQDYDYAPNGPLVKMRISNKEHPR